MKSFEQFLLEGMTLTGAVDLHNLFPKATVVNKTTSTVDSRDVNVLVEKLKKWGYVRTFADSHSMIYKQGNSVVGIDYDDSKTKATVVID